MRCEACGEPSPAGDVEIGSLARIEGASDPDDMAAVVSLHCPRCRQRDVLVLKFGPQASAADVDVLQALPDLGHTATGG